jgi:hypothetical protein
MDDPLLDAAIERLEEMTEQLIGLRNSRYEVGEVLEILDDMFGADGVLWLFRRNAALGDAPVALLLRGQQEAICQLLRQVEASVEAGIYA